MRLSEIATIRTGIVLNRFKANDNEDRVEYSLLTLKSIKNEGLISLDDLEQFFAKTQLDKKYLTQEGDVVVRLRNPVVASYITKKYKDLLVPAYFAIIKVVDNNYLPQYISAYINSFDVQKELLKEVSGSVITMVKSKTLAEMDIPDLSIEKQKIIAKISDLYIKDMNLIRKLKHEKEILYRGFFQKLLGKTN